MDGTLDDGGNSLTSCRTFCRTFSNSLTSATLASRLPLPGSVPSPPAPGLFLVQGVDRWQRACSTLVMATRPDIREARETAALSLRELSARLETCGVYVTHAHLSRLERNQRQNVSVELALGFRDVLGIPVDDWGKK